MAVLLSSCLPSAVAGPDPCNEDGTLLNDNFDGDKEIVTHYIYSIKENSDGDLVFRTHPYFEDSADYVADYWVLSEDDILGEYMFKIPKVGAVVQFAKSPFGIAAMFVNVGVIVGIMYLVKNTKK